MRHETLSGVVGGRAEYPELWEFLESLQAQEHLAGTVTAIERFGVFVALDDGPAHPVFAGVGFITLPELSWRRFAAATDVVRIGQRVTCAFLQFDTWNLEARLSLRATQPDPFQTFADSAEGRTIVGRVTHVVPFGAFVEVADGVEGFLRGAAPQVGEELTVTVMTIDRPRRKLELRPHQHPRPTPAAPR